MSEAKFTKGPWAFRPETRYIHAGIKGARITFKVLNNQYDGYLIAAAPKLYKALYMIMKSHREDMGGGFLSHEECMAADRALSKARGEQQ